MSSYRSSLIWMEVNTKTQHDTVPAHTTYAAIRQEINQIRQLRRWCFTYLTYSSIFVGCSVTISICQSTKQQKLHKV